MALTGYASLRRAPGAVVWEAMVARDGVLRIVLRIVLPLAIPGLLCGSAILLGLANPRWVSALVAAPRWLVR